MVSALTAAGTAAAAAAGLGGAAAYASLSSGSQLWGPVLVRPPLPHQLALTFDDGPNPTATPRLLDILAGHGVRATFFLIGAHARREPALARRILAEGHLVGNHTETHPWLPRHSAEFIRGEIARCSRTLGDLLGAPVTLFRAPHGARRPAVLRAAAGLGMRTVQWNLIVNDWKPVPAEIVLQRLERGVYRNRRRGRGTCVVLHDGGQGSTGEPRQPTVDAVEQLLGRMPAATSFVLPPLWEDAAQPGRVGTLGPSL